MDNEPTKVVFILGAGFSGAAGLPVQKELSTQLVKDVDAAGGQVGNNIVEERIIKYLKEFLHDVFGWYEGCCYLPDLEDFFTCIDLAANNGHHLGRFSPAMLRALRRMAIHRILRLLNKRHRTVDDIVKLIQHFRSNGPGFVVLNWDIVLENHLLECNYNKVNYCCNAIPWPRKNRSDYYSPPKNALRVAKLHGSSNWVYCDKCKDLYYLLNRKLPLKVKADLELRDFEVLDPSLKQNPSLLQLIENCLELDSNDSCHICGNRLSSHLATFSFRKSFRTHIYSSIWHEAEKMLAEAGRWIFIGYSMPAADYEFRYLLKSAQMRNKTFATGTACIDVVVKCDYAAIERYQAFFGEKLVRPHNNGLKHYVKMLVSE